LVAVAAPLWPGGQLPHKGGAGLAAGVLAKKSRLLAVKQGLRKGERTRPADLPTCGGDGRQARGGHTRANEGRKANASGDDA
jgi:hypothetical protein